MSTRTVPRRRTDDRPWLDATLDVEARVRLLLPELTLEEKAAQLHLAHNLSVAEHGAEIASGRIGAGVYSRGPSPQSMSDEPAFVDEIPALQRIARESRLGIPLLFASDIGHGHHTVFPTPLGLAATWSDELVAECAHAAAEEAHTDGLDWAFAPMADISTEARWGRIGETFGDEPTLAGRMTAAMITGLQTDLGHGAAGLAGCAKHFCGYGLVQAERDHETVPIGPNTLYNVHLRPFRAAIAAGSRSIMVGFHDVDGTPMHSNAALVRDLLKGELGFDGVVVSDWIGIGQLVHAGVADDLRDAVRQAITAGVDVDMVSGGYRAHLPELVRTGVVAEDLVDDAVARMLRTKLRCGAFDCDHASRSTLRRRQVDRSGLARRAAVAATVLVKNAGVLPLHSNVGMVHLCGPFAEDAEAMIGAWVLPGQPTGPTPAQALTAELGAENLTISDARFADLAVRRAGDADLTVAVVGEHPSRTGEDRCLPAADLPPGQLELLRALAAAGKPLVVVVLAGRPLDLADVLPLADAVLLGWHPGAEGGRALADLLLGRVEPTGRLPMNLPRRSPSGESGTLDRSTGRRAGRSSDTKFGRHLPALVHPELSLGHGLGYTTFGYSPIELSRAELPIRAGSVRAWVEVTNTGARAGREVVQLYLRDLVAEVTRPLIELADWRIVDLEPGRSTKVSFKITAAAFGYWGRDLRWRVDPGEVDVIIGPNAARNESRRLIIVD